MKKNKTVNKAGNKIAKMLFIFFILITFSLFVTFNGNTYTTELSAKSIVEKIQKVYSTIHHFRSAFTQTTSHKMFHGKIERAYGQVTFQDGGLMHWEYDRPEKKFFIYDGTTLWIYEPEVPQVFAGKTDAEKLNRALAFLSAKENILKEYNVKRLDEKKYNYAQGYVLKCSPKNKNTPFKYVELYVNAKNFYVRRTVVVDKQGNRNRLDFNTPEINPDIPKNLFSFTPPAGMPVITN